MPQSVVPFDGKLRCVPRGLRIADRYRLYHFGLVLDGTQYPPLSGYMADGAGYSRDNADQQQYARYHVLFVEPNVFKPFLEKAADGPVTQPPSDTVIDKAAELFNVEHALCGRKEASIEKVYERFRTQMPRVSVAGLKRRRACDDAELSSGTVPAAAAAAEDTAPPAATAVLSTKRGRKRGGARADRLAGVRAETAAKASRGREAAAAAQQLKAKVDALIARAITARETAAELDPNNEWVNAPAAARAVIDAEPVADIRDAARQGLPPYNSRFEHSADL